MAKEKILVVEDDAFLGDIIVTRLKTAGYDAVLAKDGEEGVRQAKALKPDLMLLDIMLPKLNGYEVLETLTKDKTTASIPVIIISNSGQPVEITRVLALGVKDYLIKAEFSPDEVLKKVRAQLDGVKAPGGGPALKILIVEDDSFLRDLLARKLSLEHCEVFYAIDGEQALLKAKEEKPAVILLDLILPGINGFEVLKRLKEDAELKSIPVIILSNLGQREDIEKAKAEGAEDFLIKSNFTIDEVVKRIYELVESKKP